MSRSQARIVAKPPAKRSATFMQRSATGGPGIGTGAAETLSRGGAPLAGPVRSDMERAFGRDFSAVRVHDDAAAHDSARAANAAAYAVGDHIVFGAGRYQSDTPAGRHLLAHELAHTAQQAGLQRRGLDGLTVGDDPALEAEADRAAAAALAGKSPTPLSTVSAPRISRTPDAPLGGAGPSEPKDEPGNPALLAKLSGIANVVSVTESQSGKGKHVALRLSTFASDNPKGPATNINGLLKRRAAEKSLVYAAPVKASKVEKLVKETGVDTEFYKGAWLSRYGYSDLKTLGARLKSWRGTEDGKKETQHGAHIDAIAARFAQGYLTGTGNRKTDANIDHMVEKQIQGQSIAENMQLLNAEENQKAGSGLNNKIVATAEAALAALADSKITAIRIDFDEIVYPGGGAEDGLTRIEQLMAGPQLKSVMSAAAMSGVETQLQSGGSTANIRIGKSKTEIANNGTNDLARALIPALDLTSYERTSAKPAKVEKVRATIDPARISAIVPKPGQSIMLDATETTPLGAAAQAPQPAPAEPAQAEAAAPAAMPARKLSFPDKSDFKFVFPYLSPGTFTKFGVDEKGGLVARGTITPTLPFLKEIGVALEGDRFEVVGDLGPEKFKPPFPGFRVREAALKLALSPAFKPSGHFSFEIGPDKKPYAAGRVEAGVEGGAFVANGTLTAQNIPGVDNASGKVRYSSVEGWKGELTATSSKVPRAKQVQVAFGFTSAGETTRIYASGGMSLDIGGGKELALSARYANNLMVYTGKLVWEKPIKLVDRVELDFRYDGETLAGKGGVPVTYKRGGAAFAGDLTVVYLRKGEEDGRISGSGKLSVKTEKFEGFLQLNVNDKGAIWGEGSVSYQINPSIRPTIGVRLAPDGKITLLGKIELTKPIILFPAKGDERDLIKINLDFIIPGPFPGLADPMVHLGAGVKFKYAIGPGRIVNTVIEGSFDPFEDDKNAQLKFTATFEVPGEVGLAGILEAGLGIAVLGGVGAKVHGGLRIEPGFKLALTTAVPITAQYANGDFAFEGRLEMTGGLTLEMYIKLYAHVEAFAGAASKDFEYALKKYSYDAAQQVKLTLAKLGYSTATGVKWPSFSDIAIEPKSIDPIPMIKRVANDAAKALGA